MESKKPEKNWSDLNLFQLRIKITSACNIYQFSFHLKLIPIDLIDRHFKFNSEPQDKRTAIFTLQYHPLLPRLLFVLFDVLQ